MTVACDDSTSTRGSGKISAPRTVFGRLENEAVIAMGELSIDADRAQLICEDTPHNGDPRLEAARSTKASRGGQVWPHSELTGPNWYEGVGNTHHLLSSDVLVPAGPAMRPTAAASRNGAHAIAAVGADQSSGPIGTRLRPRWADAISRAQRNQ